MMYKFTFITAITACALLSCKDSASTSVANTTAAAASTTTNGNHTLHEDQHVSFEYPKDWKLQLLPLESTFEKATQYSFTDANGASIFQFSIDNPSAYTLGKASLDEFIEYNNPDKLEMLSKEAFNTATNEPVYMIVLKRTDDYNNDIRILIPGNQKYEINGSAHNKTATYDAYVKTGAVVKVLKSLKIKVK